MTTYNRQQWIESFEGQLAILRPHLTLRVLNTMSLSAWHEHGRQGVDPIEVAKALSELLDQKQTKVAPAPTPPHKRGAVATPTPEAPPAAPRSTDPAKRFAPLPAPRTGRGR